MGHNSAAVIFYEAGKKMGALWTKSWKDKWALERQEFTTHLEEFIAELGWGKSSIDMESLVIKIENSFIAKNYGESEVPVCHFLRGVCAEMGEFLTNQALNCEERKCAAWWR